MPTIRKDFKNLHVKDQELGFANGFMLALVLVVGVLKLWELLLRVV